MSDHETGLSGWKCSFFPISYIHISRSTLTYRALHYGKIVTQASYVCTVCMYVSDCPMNGHCLRKSIASQATVTTEDSKPDETYVGLTENTFKTRFANRKKTSFNNPSREEWSPSWVNMYGTLKTVTLTSGSSGRFWSRPSPTTPLSNGVIYISERNIL